jgi:hypothetical protein
MMRISKPSAPSGLKLDDLVGDLLLVKPLRIETGIQTRYGPKDAVVADVHVLDGEQVGTVFNAAYVWPAVLQTQLRSQVGTGDVTLGRLGKGTAKPGESAPWVLDNPSEQDEELGVTYLGSGAVSVNGSGDTDASDDEPNF